MIYILYVILLIICIMIYIALNKIMPFIKVYEDTEKAYTDIFVTLRIRKEYLYENYPNDLDLLTFYEDIQSLDLKDRLKEELTLRSIDDTFDDYLNEALSKIDIYNKQVAIYQKEASEHRLLYKILAYKMYETLDLS